MAGIKHVTLLETSVWSGGAVILPQDHFAPQPMLIRPSYVPFVPGKTISSHGIFVCNNNNSQKCQDTTPSLSPLPIC